MTKTTKKSSAKRKLIPAVGMLTTSAIMLSSATYAWFTMNREVEITGIQMTATVPEDLQISLGEITDGSDTNSLGKSASFLAQSAGSVNPPADQNDADPFDWSNTIDISKYYQFGKLIPASSTNGANIYFTPDAKDVGKTVKDGALSYAAITGNTAGETGTGAATSHINTTNGADGWIEGTGSYATSGAYQTASAWNTPNDDGYYIDIPIWLRTSSAANANVYVTGYIMKGDNTVADDIDGDDLYKAVRVAMLTDQYSTANGVIDLNDGNAYPASIAANTSIIDSKNANDNFTLSGTNALKATGAMAAGVYDTVTVNDGSAAFGVLDAKTDAAQYGPMKKFIIRVWLEGDDENCWNANAGQDWAISLKFMTSPLPAGT